MALQEVRGLRRKLELIDIPSSSSTSRFLNLPQELVLAIVTFLDPPELCSLRLTCKILYESTLCCIGSYLQMVQTDLSLSSLKRLAEVSKTRLGPFVQTLVVQEPGDHRLGQGIRWERHSSGHLLMPQKGAQQWQDVIESLVHCRSFQIRRNAAADCIEEPGLTPSDAIGMILSIIIGAGLRVVAFSVNMKHPDGHGINRIDISRVINMVDLQTPAFITIWANLQELSLIFHMGWFCTEPTNAEGKMIAKWVIELIRRATSLRKLALDFDGGDEAASIFNRIMDFPFQLQELELRYGTLESDKAIKSFLLRHRYRLRNLSLGFLHLHGEDSWLPIIQSLCDFTTLEDITLAFLFENPGYSVETNKRVHFPVVSENPVVEEPYRFAFISKKWRKVRWNFSVSYSGPRMDLALQRLAESASLT